MKMNSNQESAMAALQIIRNNFSSKTIFDSHSPLTPEHEGADGSRRN